MSSTSSSAEQGITKRSATEVLASRYRHLFVLPSTPFLLLYVGIVSFFICISSRGVFGTAAFLPAIVVFVLSVSAVSSALAISDRRTIATFRRTTAVLLAGEIAWLFIAACGIVYTWLTASPNAVSGALVFGVFVCAGFEFLIINGVFTRNVALSLGLAALHPASTLAIIRFVEPSNHLDSFPVLFGVAAFAVIGAFTFILERRKTSRGHSSLSLLRSFMKTWAAGESADLEAIVSDHSEDAQVATKLLRFQTEAGVVFIVLPGVHPGPFHPLGSYDLPGVLNRAFEGLGHVMTLHRPGGHENNLATTAETARYCGRVAEFARTVASHGDEPTIQGPKYAEIGKAKVCSVAVSKDMILTVSFSPLGSDDLRSEVENEFSDLGREAGFDTDVVDAHNSIDHRQESLDADDPGWRRLFEATSREAPKRFRFAYSSSSEFNFPPGSDLTENGVGLAMFEAEGAKSVLVLADANNAVPALRGEVVKALEASGYRLIEFCTSDSHNLAARGLTVARGYLALGERTEVGAIADLVVRMAKSAETRLQVCTFASGKFATTVRVFGAQALEEFAAITQSSSKLGRTYLRFALASVGVLLIATLLL